jgi:hypothetical protein
MVWGGLSSPTAGHDRFVEHVLDRLARFDLGRLNYDTGWWQTVKPGD